MNAEEYLSRNTRLNAGLLQVLRRGTAEIFHQGGSGVFLKDRISGAYMLSASDTTLGRRWLREQETAPYTLLHICDHDLAEYAMRRYHFPTILECLQAVWENGRPDVPQRLTIREVSKAELPMIANHYTKLDMAELEQIQRLHNLFVAFFEGSFVGFIGCHLEGSIGLLKILPEYRGQGFATELEAFMVRRTLDLGLLPFGQVETWNKASFALQRKLGMQLSDETLYWLF
ncbi:GNAT family N-acetyltransferase [Pygmaiobacter massiliensis]|uniref:GNAT family N-acetyltransferase n=1 Tax=Pygmaiobacter massiliensis TaxID=1917873 RepID=UPI002A825E3E|nr:GNAT family N-acetyltransferase [Pygmaiobacter massiliensis]MDY4784471.1 GNAT family N-acetyltransferase [Pygmaiobacter massiliensis]